MLPQFKELKTLNLSLGEEKTILELMFKRQSKFDALENFTNERNEQFNFENENDSSFISFLDLSNLENTYNDANFISRIVDKCKSDKEFVI